ncbi:MAG: DUF5112 domain-containing protein [Prevotella sp.]|nr:DUF5112 domain-containing protein [Prevotella sp.]
MCFSACSPSHHAEVDQLNDKSYAFHYQNLDSTWYYAQLAFSCSEHYDDGKAEALNNMAFVSLARMRYQDAFRQLDSVQNVTDNQIEILVADVQLMRLCQRVSRNKDFYEYYEKARRSLRRIEEEKGSLSPRMQRRMIYARSELAIVASTYYYYIGLERSSIESLQAIENDDELEKDTAQYLNYLYQIGAGGIITQGTKEEVNQQEWDYLMKCYLLANHCGSTYWEANSLQALSEHLFDPDTRQKLIDENFTAMKIINPDHLPDSLLAGSLAERSHMLFTQYGDVYQVAGSFRTLASCYWALGDYNAAGYYLDQALHSDSAVNQAPDLVASIHERLSMTYAAIDSIEKSNIHRNRYLDMQDSTRQDRLLEARAEQLDHSVRQINAMLIAVVVMIILMVFSMLLFDYLRRRKDNTSSLNALLEPLKEWKSNNELHVSRLRDRFEEIDEAKALNEIHLSSNKRRYVENRAKIFLVNSITPLIDRMIHEVNKLKNVHEDEATRQHRYDYVAELSETIHQYNEVLTQWIQLQQGQLSLHIESFRVQDLLDIVSKGRMSFQLKGVNLVVNPSKDVVKADKTLTLFMINTLADNARKFTPQGGTVTIESIDYEDAVEIAITDTGKGMDEQELADIFKHKISGGHGFGLLNCKGIIEKYRKVSQIFSVCSIQAESKIGEGSRFSFRLPKGILRLLLPLLCLSSLPSVAAPSMMKKAETFTDSVYANNLRKEYSRSIAFADSAIAYLNLAHRQEYPEETDYLMMLDLTSTEPAEINWFHRHLHTDYDMIVFLRNEISVAALALHDWQLYQYNNKAYTQLYKEKSADNRLESYVRVMQRSESNKQIAMVLLILLLIAILVAYYFLYYRHLIQYRYCLEQVDQINQMLLSEAGDEQKLERLNEIMTTGNAKWPSNLLSVVKQIQGALQDSVAFNQSQHLGIELSEDELRRAEYENQKLYISNNVLDNCLSTLKHETMYYPSRIHQLIDGTDTHLLAIDELVSYYKELHTLLSAQAMRQLDSHRQECVPVELYGACLSGDPFMLRYLFEIIQKQSGEKNLSMTLSGKDNQYIIYHISMPHMPFRELFVPSMQNVPFLICRQIARDNGGATNLRGCGISAEPVSDGSTLLHVTLAKAHPVCSSHQ